VPSPTRISRGEVLRVRLDPIEGSEQGGERPAVVISPAIINDHSSIVIVAAITTQKTDRIYPFEALIEPPDGGLPRRSKVMLRHVRAIDRRRITGSYGQLEPQTMERVDAALKIATGLTRL
jgi:mRNA interferase MazF